MSHARPGALITVSAIAAVVVGMAIGAERYPRSSSDVRPLPLLVGAVLAVAGALALHKLDALARARARSRAREAGTIEDGGDVPGAALPSALVAGEIALLATLGLAGGGIAARTSVGLGGVLGAPLLYVAAVGAGWLAAGVTQTYGFDARHAAGSERAWTRWLLWPSLGALAVTYVASRTYPVVAVMVLLVITMATIFGHALLMGQRGRPREPGANGLLPGGALRTAVGRGPWLTATAIAVAAAVGGLVDAFM